MSQDSMLGPMEPDHLEGKGLHPIIGRIIEGDEKIDLPKWYGLLFRYDAVERCPGRLDARSVDAHGIKSFSIHDIEATASIHQHLGEPLRADDLVDHERVSSRLRDAFWVVGPIKGDGGLRPSEEGRCGHLGRIDLATRKLLKALGIVCRWLGLLPMLPLIGATGQELLHEGIVFV